MDREEPWKTEAAPWPYVGVSMNKGPDHEGFDWTIVLRVMLLVGMYCFLCCCLTILYGRSAYYISFRVALENTI